MSSLRESAPYRILRRRLSTSPRLYRFLARRLGNARLITDDTDLVIDGFPRSANSYVEAAFTVSQRPRGIAIASHTHAAAQIIEATRRDLPTVLLYRDPDEAIASFIDMAAGGLNPSLLYREYVTFYGAVLPVIDRVALAPFNVSTKDFPAVVKRTNALFGTAFAIPVVDETFRVEVACWRDKVSRARSGRPTLYSESHDSETLAERVERLARIRADVGALSDPARRKAHDLFKALERNERQRHG